MPGRGLGLRCLNPLVRHFSRVHASLVISMCTGRKLVAVSREFSGVLIQPYRAPL